MMAIRTTTTRTTSSSSAPSADSNPYSFSDLVQAYYDCRKSKRNSDSALAFEVNLEKNLLQLHRDLVNGRYQPGRSICFVVTRPKAREVWAADFRDRIVHHLLYNAIGPGIERSFVADSCACIPGRGTLYAATRLEGKVRSITQNWAKPVFYMKCNLANFFVTIDKRVLRAQLESRIKDPWWLALATQILEHDPRCNYETRSPRHLFDLVPDEQMQAVFSGTNFGHTDCRGLLAQGCIKALAGWHQGHTITSILGEIRLINWNRQSGKIKVTAKGRHYIWLAFKCRPNT